MEGGRSDVTRDADLSSGLQATRDTACDGLWPCGAAASVWGCTSLKEPETWSPIPADQQGLELALSYFKQK